MAHLKRLLSPHFWRVSKKETKWIVTPRPGPHPKFNSIPLSLILTHNIKIADTTTEAKKIVRKGEILVDGRRRKDYGYPVGLFDTISIPKLNKHYRIVSTAKGLKLIEISEKENNVKICKIENKKLLRKGKVQLNLHDGKNILVEKDNYKVGDSLLVELPSLKIVEHLPLEKGSLGLISGGSDTGDMVKVKDLVKGTIKEPQRVVCDAENMERITAVRNLIIVGKDKPAVKIAE